MEGYFFKLGLSLLTQRRRQDLPVRCKRPLERMELQSLGPYLFTWFTSTSSSSAFHGPFFISSLSISLQRSHYSFLPSISFLFLCFALSFPVFLFNSLSLSLSGLCLAWRRLKRLLPPPLPTIHPHSPFFSLFSNLFSTYYHPLIFPFYYPNTMANGNKILYLFRHTLILKYY